MRSMKVSKLLEAEKRGESIIGLIIELPDVVRSGTYVIVETMPFRGQVGVWAAGVSSDSDELVIFIPEDKRVSPVSKKVRSLTVETSYWTKVVAQYPAINKK